MYLDTGELQPPPPKKTLCKWTVKFPVEPNSWSSGHFTRFRALCGCSCFAWCAIKTVRGGGVTKRPRGPCTSTRSARPRLGGGWPCAAPPSGPRPPASTWGQGGGGEDPSHPDVCHLFFERASPRIPLVCHKKKTHSHSFPSFSHFPQLSARPMPTPYHCSLIPRGQFLKKTSQSLFFVSKTVTHFLPPPR